MLKMFVIIISLIQAHAQASVIKDTIPENVRLQNTLISCLILSDQKQDKCVSNVGNSIRKAINANLQRLDERDRIYFLNLRAKPAEEAKNACSLYQDKLLQNVCIAKINIILLSELSIRYLK